MFKQRHHYVIHIKEEHYEKQMDRIEKEYKEILRTENQSLKLKYKSTDKGIDRIEDRIRSLNSLMNGRCSEFTHIQREMDIKRYERKMNKSNIRPIRVSKWELGNISR